MRETDINLVLNPKKRWSKDYRAVRCPHTQKKRMVKK